MELEWDEAKGLQTLVERGMDFADVANFDPVSLITAEDLRADYGELRFNVFGELHGVLCTYCWTPRNGNMRVISMRKINERERRSYRASKERKPADNG